MRRAALEFYVPLFGQTLAGPGPMPGDLSGEYFVARVKGRDVAGIGSLPYCLKSMPPSSST
jgi:hypothetical protein